LKFDRPGVKTIFLEQESVVDGRVYATSGPISGLNCSVRSQDGASIGLRRPTASTSYALQGRAGKSALEFSVPAAGTYHFECGYEQGQSGPTVVVAVGSGVGTAIVVSLAAGFWV